jgi:hypothetical protein
MASTDARPIPQKNVAYRVTFPIFDADGDLVTGATGLDSEVSKDGGTFADCTNEATEIATSSGMYYLDLTSTEMNADTVAIIVKTSSSGAKTTPIVLYPEEAGDIRVNVTQFGGTNGTFASGRPEVNTTHAAGTAWGSGAITAGSFAQAAADKVWSTTSRTLSAFGFSVTVGTNNDKTGYSLSAAGIQAIWDALTSALTTVGSIGKRLVDNLDATVSSRLASSSYTAPDNTSITAIKAKTDNLPASPAAVGSAMTLTSGERTAIANEVEAQIIDDTDSEKVLTAITDKIASVNPSLDDLTLAGIASAVRTELTTELGRIDVAVSSRASQASVDTIDDYVDSEIGAIKTVTDKLNTALELDGAEYRFTTNALEQAPSGGGGGATAAQIADAVWDEVIDDHLRDRSFGAKIGVQLSAGGVDIDYKRIKKLIDTAIENQKFPEYKEFDPTPISEALQALFEEIRAIDIPKAEKADFTPVLRRLDDIDKAVKAIRIPETDLSPIERHLDKQDKIIKPQVEEIKDTLEQMLERVRQYFDGDMETFKREVESIKETFESIPYVVMEVKDKPKPTEPKAEKKEKPSVLDEYLNLK